MTSSQTAPEYVPIPLHARNAGSQVLPGPLNPARRVERKGTALVDAVLVDRNVSPAATLTDPVTWMIPAKLGVVFVTGVSENVKAWADDAAEATRGMAIEERVMALSFGAVAPVTGPA